MQGETLASGTRGTPWRLEMHKKTGQVGRAVDVKQRGMLCGSLILIGLAIGPIALVSLSSYYVYLWSTFRFMSITHPHARSSASSWALAAVRLSLLEWRDNKQIVNNFVGQKAFW